MLFSSEYLVLVQIFTLTCVYTANSKKFRGFMVRTFLKPLQAKKLRFSIPSGSSCNPAGALTFSSPTKPFLYVMSGLQIPPLLTYRS